MAAPRFSDHYHPLTSCKYSYSTVMIENWHFPGAQEYKGRLALAFRSIAAVLLEFRPGRQSRIRGSRDS